MNFRGWSNDWKYMQILEMRKNINLYRWNPLAWKFNKLKTGESSDEINSNNHGTLR